MNAVNRPCMKIINNLHKIQKHLRVTKNNKNNFGNYTYRNAEDILSEVKPLLEEGIVLLLTEKIELIGDRYYVKSTAILTDGTDKIENCAYARESLDKKGMDAAQITGASTSYARKYALGGLFLLDDNKDYDAMDVSSASVLDNKSECSQPSCHDKKNKPKINVGLDIDAEKKEKFRRMAQIYIDFIESGEEFPSHKLDMFKIVHRDLLDQEYPYYFSGSREEILDYLRGLL